MARSMLLASIAAASCCLFPHSIRSQEPARLPDSIARLAEAEFEVEMRGLELAMAERAVDDAKIEAEKIELHLRSTQVQQEPRELAHAKLELKQAGIRIEMREIEVEIARLRVKRAKSHKEFLQRAMLNAKPKSTARTQVEYLEDLGVIVIRGTAPDVKKIKDLIGNAQDKKQDESD